MTLESGSLPKGTKVLVTGATGFTGRSLVRKLAEMGAEVRAIARASSSLEGLKDLSVAWFRGDVFDPQTIEQAAEGVDYIFHLAAAYREAKLTREDYWNVHVASTQLLSEAALKNPNFKRLVHVSTIGVHGHIPNPPANEEEPMRPGDIYQETKAEAEFWLHEFAREKNLDYTVIRPAGIFGPGDKRLLKLFRFALKPVFPVLGYGACLYHLIHVEDLTRAMIVAATHEKSLGEAFICGNTECTTIPEIGRIVAEYAGRPFRLLRLPAWPFFILGALCEGVCIPLGLEPPIYRRRVAFYTKNRSFDTRKMREVLGVTPQFSNEEGIQQTAAWYKSQGWL